MPKDFVKQSLERDAYLSRLEDKETARQHLQKSVERLSKLMSLSSTARDELSIYADELLEQRIASVHEEKGSQVRRRVMQARTEEQKNMPPAQTSPDGTTVSKT
jgi:hypothetical protein